jgi:hypothetical protein
MKLLNVSKNEDLLRYQKNKKKTTWLDFKTKMVMFTTTRKKKKMSCMYAQTKANKYVRIMKPLKS